MPAKMISDMPLPMPRSVICSPSHMMKAVPVVSESMVIRMKPKPGIDDDTPAMALQARGDAEGLHQRQDHGQIAGPLRDLAPAQLAFLLQLFERRDHHGQQLQDDRRRDVGHDAQREDRQPADVAAAEQVEEAEDGALVALEELFQAVGVDAGSRDVPAQAVDRQQRQREQDTLAQIRDPKNVRNRLRRTSWLTCLG